ncbi:MAG: hypothetical protein WBG43_09280 [Marinifilaceae bacterium]
MNMNKTSIIYFKLFLLISLLLLACSKDEKNELSEKDKNKNTTKEPFIIKPSFESIKDIVSLHGNLKSDIVIVNAQAGPLITLDIAGLDNFISRSNSKDLLYVNVHQTQTKQPDLFSLNININDGRRYTKESVNNLKKVIDFYSNIPEKTVYVLGMGYGGYLIQEFIANYGLGTVKEYLIVAARLDVEKVTCDICRYGQVPIYKYDAAGNFTIEIQPIKKSVYIHNMTMLSFLMGDTHYSEKLSHIKSLKHLTYIYGERDEILGPLSIKEVEFLKSKGAEVICAFRRNHSLALISVARQIRRIFGI